MVKRTGGAGLPRFVDRAKSIVGVGLGSDRKNVVRENENNSIDEGHHVTTLRTEIIL